MPVETANSCVVSCCVIGDTGAVIEAYSDFVEGCVDDCAEPLCEVVDTVSYSYIFITKCCHDILSLYVGF